MKSFRFRLDTILDYRTYLKKKAQTALLKARNAYLIREKEVMRLANERLDVAKECEDEGVRGMNVATYKIYRTFLQKLDYDLKGAHLRLQEKENEVHSKEKALQKASINEKTLEILKNEQHRKYLETSFREEQKALDEMVLMRRELGI